jgi:predicted amidohydrolase YtcJ
MLAAFGLSLGSALLNNYFAGQRQDDAQDFSAQQFATRYQTTVKDMQLAGLNPMLAYSQGGGSAPTSSAASAAGSADMGSTYIQSKLTSAQVDNIEAQTRLANAQAAAAEATALPQAQASLEKTLAETGLSVAQSKNVASQTDNNIAQLNNIKSENERIIRASEMLYQQANLLSQQQLTEVQRERLLRAQAAKYVSETALNKLDLDAANQLENSGRLGREVKPFFDMLRSLMRK